MRATTLNPSSRPSGLKKPTSGNHPQPWEFPAHDCIQIGGAEGAAVDNSVTLAKVGKSRRMFFNPLPAQSRLLSTKDHFAELAGLTVAHPISSGWVKARVFAVTHDVNHLHFVPSRK